LAQPRWLTGLAQVVQLWLGPATQASATLHKGLQVHVERHSCGSSLVGIDAGALAGTGVGIIAGSGGYVHGR